MAPYSYEIIHDLWWRLDQLVKTTNAAVLRETKEKQSAGRKACVGQWAQALVAADKAKRAAADVYDLARATRFGTDALLPKIKEWQKTVAACITLTNAVMKLLSHETFDQDDRNDLSASLSTFQRYLIPDLKSFQKEIERMK